MKKAHHWEDFRFEDIFGDSYLFEAFLFSVLSYTSVFVFDTQCLILRASWSSTLLLGI